MSETERKINTLLDRLKEGNNQQNSPMNSQNSPRNGRPILQLGFNSSRNSPVMSRPSNLSFSPAHNDNAETDRKLREIEKKISGNLTINNILYKTDIKDMENLEELGNGTCGHVVKMRHKPSGNIIAVKQMRRSGNTDENNRIIMDIEVVLKSHDCEYIVGCLGCFITESEVWICMELMDSCFDKLLKKLKRAVPEEVLGKVTVATVEALSYLKDRHDVIHRDVKPSNILLDTKGNVKLCDFGISGRLVDSMAKTRQAGCAAYMAPERIEPDPNKPEYDVRADVWSLGITLVELATGVFPYQDCKTDFEMLTKVIADDPPALPNDKNFSPEFRGFINSCLRKDKRNRPKYKELKGHEFFKKYAKMDVNVGEWFVSATQQADAVAKRGAPRPNLSSNPIRHFFTSHQKQPPGTSYVQEASSLINGSQNAVISTSQSNFPINPEPPKAAEPSATVTDGRVTSGHNSRLSAFQSTVNNQRDGNNLPHLHQRTTDFPTLHQSTNILPNNRSYSPFQAYQNHLASLQQRNKPEPHLPGYIRSDSEQNRKGFESPVLPRRLIPAAIAAPNDTSVNSSVTSSPYPQRRATSDSRWRSPSASPLPLRNQFQVEEQQYNSGNTSPIILQRFYHQQKQQQMAKEAEETGKKRFASYIKLQLGNDKSGRSSRHQSPEPPPRLNRVYSGENQSPLALRRTFLETHTSGSPSLSRRYVSPTPPVPPPRRLSESNSVPGSPQHLRARFHYTPEPQRRLFQNNDIS